MTEDYGYLTIKEVAARLKLETKTVKNKMAAGVFRKGVHYFSPVGMGPRFKWSAVQAWLEGTDKPITKQLADEVPMARGYLLESARKS
jgi:hypothetical protein